MPTSASWEKKHGVLASKNLHSLVSISKLYLKLHMLPICNAVSARSRKAQSSQVRECAESSLEARLLRFSPYCGIFRTTLPVMR